MRRFTTALMLGLLLASFALADAFQACWRLQDGAGNNLLDVLRLAATQEPATSPVIFGLHGEDTAAPLYHQVGSGSATQDTMQPSRFRLVFTSAHNAPGFFGNNQTCSLTASLIANPADPNYLGGTWSTQCPGPTPFNVSGLIVYFDCPVLVSQFQRMQQDIQAEQMSEFGAFRAAGCDPEQPCLPSGE